MKELKETIPMMLSDDYRERFKAEYWQAKIRIDKLNALICNAESGRLDFKPTCSMAKLNIQFNIMKHYIAILEKRAEIEGVKLDE